MQTLPTQEWADFVVKNAFLDPGTLHMTIQTGMLIETLACS